MVACSPISHEHALADLKRREPATWMATIRRAHTEIRNARRQYELTNSKAGNAAAVRHILEKGTVSDYFALIVVTGLLEYRVKIETYHEQAELNAFHFQEALDKLNAPHLKGFDTEGMRMHYTREMALAQDKAEISLKEIIFVAKLLGTESTVPEPVPQRYRHGGHNHGNHLAV